MRSFVCLLLIAVIFVVGCGGGGGGGKSPSITTEVIDLSHNSILGHGFGDIQEDICEVKRWQTFIATSCRAVTAVEVKIRKMNSGTAYTPVLVELYETTADGKPTGERLAYGLINPDWITTEFTVVKTGLNYNGLIAGKQYAIVLTQGVLSINDHYEWCARVKVDPNLHFGKYTAATGWEDESGLGDGWLKVYVASAVTPPTKIYLYFATSVHDGNLKGSYPDARTGADFITAYRPLSLAGKTTHAFISISPTDSIADMPARFGFPNNIPIVSAIDDTKIIADNWNDLLDGSIKMNFHDALGLDKLDTWWSGSNTNGTYDDSSDNCSGWTSNSKTSKGMTGVTDEVDTLWIHFTDGPGDYARWVLGIAY